MDQPPGRKRARAAAKTASKTPPASISLRSRAEPLASSPRSGVEPRVSTRDTVLIHGVSEDGEKLAVLRARDDRVEAGVISKLKEGEPLHGELVRLTPHADYPLLCDVDVELAHPSARADQQATQKLSHGGPAQVATESYRTNWDAIWRKPPSKPN